MKEKWNKLATFLGLTAFVTSADGIFMSEENIDRMEAVRVENERLLGEASTVEATHIEAIQTLNNAHATEVNSLTTNAEILNADIVRLTTELETANANLQAANISLAKFTGGPAPIKGVGADPDNEVSKKKLSAREHQLEKTAAEFRGEKYTGDTTEEEEDEVVVGE